MGSFRSKEDDVSKIFDFDFFYKFHGILLLLGIIPLVKQYGHVVDSFIPTKRTKDVIGKSFMFVVKTSRMPIDKESPPAIVLEDDCLNAKDLTLSLMGRVKEIASLVNLKKALCNEGFDVVKISYLGELWVLLEFETAKAKDSFRGNVGVGSWFSVIKQAYAEFVPEGRLVWVELEGSKLGKKWWTSRFFNGQDPKSNKASWVKWNKVLTPKDKGGLGVSSLFALNRGLMLKWVWRFYSQKCSLWTKVIKAIYGEDGNLNKDVSGGVRTCWTSIVHELGNGENTRFWLDNWYEGGVIKELFLRMFALELNKNATVSSKLNASSLDNSFRRKARSEIEEMQLNSLAEISRMTTLVPCEDRYVWTLESDGVFSVASIRKEIDGNQFQDVSLPTRWVKYVPIKVNNIAGKVKLTRSQRVLRISRRGMVILIRLFVLFVMRVWNV
ncbi:hypothetical protein Tco_1064411 [Tanacetum coccineum]